MEKFELYEVGGCVRDELLGIKSKDIDYSFVFKEIDNNLTPEDYFIKMKNCLIEIGVTIYQERPDCFTIRGKLNNKDVDFVMARKEIYSNPKSRIPIVEMGTLYDDQCRRDFTVNSIAKDFDGNIIDLFDGVKDLNDGILRTPTDAVTSLHADPLRILRAFRFKITKHLVFSDDLSNAICNFEVERLELVSTERVREELFKMFKHCTIRSLNLFYWLRNNNYDLFKNIFDERGISLEPTLKK